MNYDGNRDYAIYSFTVLFTAIRNSTGLWYFLLISCGYELVSKDIQAFNKIISGLLCSGLFFATILYEREKIVN